MPMMVRLVDGKPPTIPNKNHSSFKKFVPELRLFSTIQEELIFGMPLSQNSKEIPNLLPLPQSAPLKFQVCCNFAQVEQMKEFCRLYEKMKSMMDVAKDLIQIYDINLKRELRFDGRQWKAYSPPIFFTNNHSTGDNDASSPSTPTTTTQQQQQHQRDVISTSPNPYNNYEVPDVQDYEDIDQIYDYVRGVKPIPKSSHVLHYHPKIQHPTTQVVISQFSSTSSKHQKVSRTTAGVGAAVVAVEKKRQYTEQQQQKISLPSSQDDHLIREPVKPPRRLSSSSRPFNAMMRRSVSEDRLLDIDVAAAAAADEKPEPPPIETIPTHKNNLRRNTNKPLKQKTDTHRVLNENENDDDGDGDDDDGFNANYGFEDGYTSSGGEDEYDSLKVTVRHSHQHHHSHHSSSSKTNCYEVTCNNGKEASKKKEHVVRNPLNFNHRVRNHKSTTSTTSTAAVPPTATTAAVTARAADDHYQEIEDGDGDGGDDEQTRKLIQKQRNTSKVLISCESSPNNTNTTNTTSSSGVSSGEVGAIISIKTNDNHHNHNRRHHLVNCANDHANTNIISNSIDDCSIANIDSSNNSHNNHYNNHHHEKGKVKKYHYIKRNSKETSAATTATASTTSPNNVINICSNKSPSPMPICTTPAGLISGSPSNRIIFRRSPIFDCRYKSMNDLNRGSLESSASGSSSSGGGGGGLGNKLSRYFQLSPHNNQTHHNHYHQLYDRGMHNSNNISHSHNNNNNTALSQESSTSNSSKQFGSSSSGFLSRRSSPHYHSNSNINVNLLNLNIKASSRHKALFRPKSLTNLVDITPASVRSGFGLSGLGLGKLGAAGKSSCRKKLLDNMVVPSHHHALHSSVPSFDVFQKLTNLSSSTSSKRNSYCSSGGGAGGGNTRKHSHLPSLYL